MRTALFFFVFGLAAARSQQQFADIGDLRLENGQTIPHCRIVSDDIGRANGGSMARAAARVTAKALVVVATQDHMVNPLPALESAPKIHARVVDLTGNCGHMATSCEAGKLASAVKHSWRSEHPGRAVRHPMFPWNPNIAFFPMKSSKPSRRQPIPVVYSASWTISATRIKRRLISPPDGPIVVKLRRQAWRSHVGGGENV